MSVVSRENAEHYIWGDACDRWRLLARAASAVRASGFSTIQL